MVDYFNSKKLKGKKEGRLLKINFKPQSNKEVDISRY